uniref:Uncharacterized protein n=1 Tax=Arundo donax TaxID=35708 RepID=A0A0A9C6A1_ARUDO
MGFGSFKVTKTPSCRTINDANFASGPDSF